jgi:hypothetical protein
MANEGAVAIGIILLIIGLIAVGSSIQTYNQCNSTLGQIAQQVSPSTAQQCSNAELLTIGGGLIGLIGLIALIGGAVASSPSPPVVSSPPVWLVQAPPAPPPVQSGWLCANCRGLNSQPTGARVQFCQHCGTQHFFGLPPPPP